MRFPLFGTIAFMVLWIIGSMASPSAHHRHLYSSEQGGKTTDIVLYKRSPIGYQTLNNAAIATSLGSCVGGVVGLCATLAGASTPLAAGLGLGSTVLSTAGAGALLRWSRRNETQQQPQQPQQQQIQLQQLQQPQQQQQQQPQPAPLPSDAVAINMDGNSPSGSAGVQRPPQRPPRSEHRPPTNRLSSAAAAQCSLVRRSGEGGCGRPGSKPANNSGKPPKNNVSPSTKNTRDPLAKPRSGIKGSKPSRGPSPSTRDRQRPDASRPNASRPAGKPASKRTSQASSARPPTPARPNGNAKSNRIPPSKPHQRSRNQARPQQQRRRK